jgi:hypothetical protein
MPRELAERAKRARDNSGAFKAEEKLWPSPARRFSSKTGMFSEESNLCNTSNQTTHGEEKSKPEVIKLGLDLHARQVTECRQLDGSTPKPAQQRDPLLGNLESYLQDNRDAMSIIAVPSPSAGRHAVCFGLVAHGMRSRPKPLCASSESGLAVSLDAPGRPVFQGPIKQGTFKTDVVASFLALDPFVTKNLLAFG